MKYCNCIQTYQHRQLNCNHFCLAVILLTSCWNKKLQRKSKFKHQCQNLHHFFFLFHSKLHPFQSADFLIFFTFFSPHESSNNLEINNGYLLFNMSAVKPLVGSCRVYSNVACRAGAVCTFPAQLKGLAAISRQKAMLKHIQSLGDVLTFDFG